MADYTSIIPLLNKVPLFQDLNEEDHKEIIDHITMMYYPPQYRIFTEGDEGDALYIIKTGEVRVFEEESGYDIAILKPYHFFGEMALFDDRPRNASVETLTEVEVVILKKEDFYRLVAANENISKMLSKQYFLRAQVNEVRDVAEKRQAEN